LLDAWKHDYPDDAQAHFMEAYLMQALAMQSEAIAAYRRGLELEPAATIMRCRLAELLAETQEVDEADALFQRCVEEAPDSAEILTAWARALAAQGDLKRAQTILRRALDKTPDHFEALRQLGEVEVMEGSFDKALPHLQQALALRPYDTTTHNALGKALRALSRADEAQVHFDYVTEAEQSLERMERQLRVVTDRPDDVQLRLEIGTTLLKYGDPEDGARWMRTVLELDPDNQAAHRALAAYYANRGQWRQAAAHRQQGAEP
jgi:tetratricopeptide (TPR) repeat protein